MAVFLFDFMSMAKSIFFLSALVNFNMLNVRIIKGGCRGREAAKFGSVGFKANVFLHEEISIHFSTSDCTDDCKSKTMRNLGLKKFASDCKH